MTAPAEPAPTALRQLRRDLVISFLAVVSVGIGVYELLRPRVDRSFTAIDALDLAIVAVFIVDFVQQARRSGDAWAYTRRHWWELPSLIPVTSGLVVGLDGFPLLRGVRLVRLLRVLRLLRVVGAVARIRRVRGYVMRIAGRAHLTTLAAIGTMLILTGAAVGWVAEAGVNPRITTYWDALWWSLNIFTTVAYLDFQPRTTTGFVTASLLAILGVVFVGVFTASLASAILREPGPVEEDEQAPPEPALE